MDAQAIETLIGAVGPTVTAVAAGAYWVAKPLRRVVKQNDEFRVDWYGQPARPGLPPRPGVMERLATIEKQLNDHLISHQRQVP